MTKNAKIENSNKKFKLKKSNNFKKFKKNKKVDNL